MQRIEKFLTFFFLLLLSTQKQQKNPKNPEPLHPPPKKTFSPTFSIWILSYINCTLYVIFFVYKNMSSRLRSGKRKAFFPGTAHAFPTCPLHPPLHYISWIRAFLIPTPKSSQCKGCLLRIKVAHPPSNSVLQNMNLLPSLWKYYQHATRAMGLRPVLTSFHTHKHP